MGAAVDEEVRLRATRALFIGLLAVLFVSGWAANHFAALIPVIGDRQHLSAAALDAIFGVYAVGLLPGLLFGGRASDALGRQPVAFAGAVTTLVATLAMLASQDSGVLLVGRLIIGLGVGLAMSACTVWASDLRGPAGAAVAGAVLTFGFAIGPFAGGMIASAGQRGIRVSFAIAAALVVAATGVAFRAARRGDANLPAPVERAVGSAPARRGTAWALSWALPLAPWVFASATVGFITIPTRVHTAIAAPLVAGTATLIVNASSGTVQLVARWRRWGPRAGIVGAVLAALGYAVMAAVPTIMPLQLALVMLVVLGCAAGLLLREGLIDLETTAPAEVRGALTGVFYCVTYIGFGLPLLLEVVGSKDVASTILVVMAALALTTAVGRAVRLRRDSHRQ